MNEEIIGKLQSYNFKVTSKGIIEKYSKRSRRYETAGQINEAGVYFHAQNVSPFKQGQNTFKEIFGDNKPYTYTPVQKGKEVEYSFSFAEYKKTTQSKNQFLIYLKAFHKRTLSKELTSNLYDVRGVKNGYLKDATLFPYINYNNDFVTAKIVKYNSNTGKRSKEKYSNNWFHSYKEIKKELKIKDKVSKSVDCFFGEHLLAFNDKPVVIVEAEKTAILLSLVFKETIFIASGGLAKLKSLDHSFLADREVFLFPDNNAAEWFEIAEKRGWWTSNILENEAKPGEDVADYLTSYKDNEEKSSIWWKLQEQLWNINAGEITLKSTKTYNLGFEQKKKLSKKYCLPIPKELNLSSYYDNAKGEAFKGINFQIFQNDFRVLNANIDFNKTYKTEFGWQQMNADQFIKKLEKCFRIVKHLNSEKDYKKLFSKALLNLLFNSNHIFNIGYIERVLIPFWDNDINEIEKHYKFRNWRFSSVEVISTNREFQKRLYEDKKLFSTNELLKKLQPLLKEKRFILTEEIGLHQKSNNEYVWNLVKKYNEEVIGCTTLRNYQSKLKVSEYLNWWVENINKLDVKAKLYIKFNTTYNNTNIRCKKICTIYKIPPVSVINENTLVHRKIINEYFSFKPEAEVLKNIISEVDDYIHNPQSFSFERINKHIVVTPAPIKEKEQIIVSAADAFDDKPSLVNSVLNISEADAMQQNTNFLSSWILFHYPKLTDDEKEYIRKCPMYYLNEKNQILKAS